MDIIKPVALSKSILKISKNGHLHLLVNRYCFRVIYFYSDDKKTCNNL